MLWKKNPTNNDKYAVHFYIIIPDPSSYIGMLKCISALQMHIIPVINILFQIKVCSCIIVMLFFLMMFMSSYVVFQFKSKITDCLDGLE